ncbi:TPA: DUF262 domain-containing protein [Campylobacter lari]|uniref:DUF262 domain-containing protein n=1 Tax=Campylobacter sp. FU_497 TaxID=2911610 RepID=UPI0021E6C272|nr:DUF262 domain-containing protein [Campylobacter sp. FU_497]MCV3462175.1 DUF262 domain-containing protein [Campylobacter sp. FU_497]HEC1758424.1 DUF262 domain-containing protein [Campylobacter lari]
MESNLVNNQNQVSVISIGSIDNKEQSIFFEIPPYQRLYEWNKEQIQTLLNDIKTKFDENKNKEYFIGNVVVSKKDDKYLLIDGQQRLTTLFLIGFFLSYKNPSDQPNWKEFIMQSDKLRISMPIREKEEKVLKEFAKFCNKDNKDNERRKNDIFLQKLKEFPQDICQNIPQALEIIVNWFEENIKNNDIEGFSNFIYSNAKFVFVELAENTDLNRFFIRMNNRGKQLEKHEILKARLLSKFNDEDESKRTLYAHIWDICSQMDNYIFQKASDRVISKSNESSGGSINNIIEPENSFDKPNQDKANQGKFKSIVDFPTFLLHVYKLTFLEEKQNKNNDKNFTIDKNKLLEIIKIEEKESREKAKKFIENLLKYRILFDYFVIKSQDDMENSYKIRRLTRDKNNTYSISEDSNAMPELAMVQNYLRVARSGMSNNHHHWLTPFLKFLDDEIELKISYEVGNDNMIDRIDKFDKFATNSRDDISKLILFLENLDTALAKEQLQNNDFNKILNSEENLETTDDFGSNEFIKEQETQKSILDQGTATLHYWFYRLEYYLWKYSKTEYNEKLKDNEKLKEIDWENFSKIASNFYFRSLNSIEHVQAQSKAQGWGEVDNFGNLALISSSFNSSLNNQDVPSKYRDFQKRYVDNKKAVISLKLWLIYALIEENQLNWTFEKAKEHKKQMLEVLTKSFESS